MADNVKPSRRQMQAAATRRDVVDAARRLFAADGYAATPITRIAADAGVAVQTIYKSFGTKDAILFAMLDDFEAEARRLSEVVDFAAADEPAEQVRLLAAFHRALFDASRDIIEVFRSAAHGDLGALWDEGGRRRRRGQSALVGRWHAEGALASGVSRRRAADIVWALTSPEMYSLLVVQSGWSSSNYEDWVADTLTSQLLRAGSRVSPPVSPSPHRQA